MNFTFLKSYTLTLIIGAVATTTALAEVTNGDFYISPIGDDSNSGSIAAPFATLERAKLAVRELKKTKEGDVKVYLREGHYEVSNTVIFGLQDSGSANQSITYAAYPGEEPTLSAGQKIEIPTLNKTEIPNLPKVAQKKVAVIKVNHSFKTLFDKDGILPRASSPMFITEPKGGRNRINIPKSVYKKWSSPEHLEVAVRPHHAWILNILPVTSANHTSHSFELGTNASYSINRLHFLKTTENAWIENAIEELDQPGEWALNPKEGLLYIWPRTESPIFSANLNEIIRIEGDIDLEGSYDKPVEHLHFKGITFKHGERYHITENDKGVQHDWNFFDKDNALFRMRGAENCSISDSHFLHSGSGAVRIDLHGMHNTVSGNHIEHIGGSGIFLCGYGPGTKDVNGKNLVYNNHIHDVGEIYWHSPGIHLSQSGENRVANNYVHHTNYSGIIISGFVQGFFTRSGRESSRTVRWNEVGNKKTLASDHKAAEPFLHTHDNIIENNEISHVMQKMGDGNAIYIRGAGAGNIIRRNYIHDLITPMIMQCAIRTDGGQRDTLITENIIYRCTSQGMMLKLNNRFENNIIADVISPPRGYYLSLREGPMNGVIKQNIFYATGDFTKFIHELSPKFKDKTEDSRGRAIARLSESTADQNLYYSAKFPERAASALKENQAQGKDLQGMVGDPLFKDPVNGDFSIPKNSPAHKIGFKPIDQSKIGLIKRPE